MTRARVARLGFFVVALVALVFVDCFNAPQSAKWTDLGRAPHLAATVQRQGTERPHSSPAPAPHVPASLVTPFSLWLCLLLLGVAAVRRDAMRSNVCRAGPSSRAPPVALT